MSTRSSPTSESPAEPRPANALTLLIVDDQPAVRAGLGRLLRAGALAQAHVVMAGTRAQALAMAARHPPDLVILDVDLAGEDGLELVTQFGPGARVLVLTSHGDARTRERARALGAAAFVDKRAPASELIHRLAELAR